ncbi:DUF481 domain-containing protein [Sphingomonas immobilis]|uniref:DUF481 domain-containing protein n=1 Tax=Sphingomonas immobilis TaxID=3063997 RepID=A0ABT8ZZI4_9SPHN|nr:DUF481 domain-containing protein [Sphingomonas sp. CA1-15]MDO7842995.1 DUF481 domain-containing protein [Sphingomonas sp. CA1-15]
MRFCLILLAAPLLIAAAEKKPALAIPEPLTPIPVPVRAMLDAAVANGNESEVAIVAKYATTAAPEAARSIKAVVDQWRDSREARRQIDLANAGPLDNWKGKAQLGGYLTTGNTNDMGVSGAVELTRETLRWKHKVNLAVDYKQSSGVISREHFLAAYEPNFKFSPRGYLYGAAQFESDRFLGYYDRYSGSVGAGYGVIRDPNLKLDMELGPAYRRTSFTDATQENSIAARGSMNMDWKLSHAISLTQVASAYLQKINSTVSSTTALNAKLFGPLSGQLSYAVQYESMPPIGRRNTDTSSTAALVYNF